MSEEKELTIKEQAAKDFRPTETPLLKGEGSGFKVKDSKFTKEKSFMKKNGQPDSIQADWLRVNLGRTALILFKGSEISKENFAKFDERAKEHFLTAIKKGKK